MAKVDFKAIRSRERETSRTVPCEAWGGDVTLERMSPAERLDFMIAFSELVDENGDVSISGDTLTESAAMLSKSIVNEDGAREFDSDEGRDELATEHLAAVVELLPAMLSVNGIGEATPVEEAKKK